MTGEELEQRLRNDNKRVTIFGAIDTTTLLYVLAWSRRTLGYRIEEGRAPPFKKRTGKLWFDVAALADWMNRNDW